MERSVGIVLGGVAPAAVFEHVALLDRYPAWMRLVHKVDRLEPDEGRPAWWVELRARVGPLARSKQLRMVRVAAEPERYVRYERVQPDERDHANWILAVTISPVAAGTHLQMDLAYTGDLWTGGVLGRVLEDEIARGVSSLRHVLGALGA